MYYTQSHIKPTNNKLQCRGGYIRNFLRHRLTSLCRLDILYSGRGYCMLKRFEVQGFKSFLTLLRLIFPMYVIISLTIAALKTTF